MKKRLNILMVNETSGPGGAETVLFEIACNLNRERYNVSVVLARQGWFVEHLRSHGIPTEVITSNRSWDISFVKRLAAHCRTQEIDLIHAHLPGSNLYGSIVGKMIGIPVITTGHNELVMPDRRERFVKIKSWIIRKFASANVLVADFMHVNYIKLGGYRENEIMTIHNGTKFCQPPTQDVIDKLRDELNLKPDDIIIGNVANLRTPKGHQYLVEAAGIVCNKLPQAKFLLIGEEGDGSIRMMIKEKATSLGVTDRVKLLGFRKDIPELLHLLDIFVLSSISEGLPLSVVEAMAAGKPVVVTNVGGLSEVVTDGVDGYIVPPAQPEALADKLLKLAEDKSLREKMGAIGFDNVKVEFSLETMISRYENLYESLIK